MIKRILIVSGILIVLGLLILWIINGGPRKIWQQTGSFTNFSGLFRSSTSTGAGFRLPWQPDFSIPQIQESPDDTRTDTDSRSASDRLASSQQEYDSLNTQVAEAKDFGTPSPYRGKVQISDYGGPTLSGEDEYMGISASSDATAPVDITGWSFQSVVSGVRAYIPRGSTNFLMGAVNAQGGITLDPGASATVSSGFSPVGTSFRENMCSGYLAQFQRFSPGLSHDCPYPSDYLPLNADNIRIYGDTCFDFVRSLNTCEAPLSIPPGVSPACGAFVANNFSYNGCVTTNQYKSTFARDSWRIYLGASGELWRNSHDVIRLLDASGRTVDLLSY